MKYMGSKNRYAKYILPIILRNKVKDQAYVEPFVGGANLIDKVHGVRIGADINPYLIQALKSIRDCLPELPKNNSEFAEAQYKELRQSDKYKYKGYAGFAFSYGGKWLGGWRRDSEGKRDYVSESYRNAEKQSPRLKGIDLICCQYDKLDIPAGSVIYCDPPSQNTTKYKDSFEHGAFWQWCRDMVDDGHEVFISEYSAPDDFVCIWSKEVNNSLTKETGSKKGVECLFKHNSQMGI